MERRDLTETHDGLTRCYKAAIMNNLTEFFNCR